MISTPDWLSLRGGQIRPGVSADTWLILLSNMQEYAAAIAPADGKFTCVVTQRNNGKRLDKGTVYAAAEAALQGGLEDLKRSLGWG
jgi:hypothetical protein